MKLASAAIFFMESSAFPLFWDSRNFSISIDRSKWSSMARLCQPVIMIASLMPEATASSTTYWMIGLSITGSISLGIALVAGKNLVPQPAAGMTTLVISSVRGFGWCMFFKIAICLLPRF